MKSRQLFGTAFLFSTLFLAGCEHLPGRPHEGPEVPRPEQVKAFQTLYQQNCAGCHGTNGEKGPATNLANPVYQALVDDATLRDVIAKGQKDTLMPGFGKAVGGFLSDEQVEILVKGIRGSWPKGTIPAGQALPPYHAEGPGDPEHGKQVYQNVCARCHGVQGGPPGKNGSILDGSFLALVSEQTIRTTVIAGRPDLGMPDWRSLVQGRALTNQEITDVVAWVVAQKPTRPGQPYPHQQAPEQAAGMKGAE